MSIINFSGKIGGNPKPLKNPSAITSNKQEDEKEVINNNLDLKKVESNIKEKKEQLKKLEQEILERENALKDLKNSIIEKENFLTSLEEEILDHTENLNSIKKTKNINIKLMDINEWKNRRLESIYSIVFINIVNLKLEREDDNVFKYIYSVIGIDINGKRDVLGIWLYDKDLTNSFLEIFQEIKSRGIEDILIISTPLTEEYNKGISKIFPKSKIEISMLYEIKDFKNYVCYKDWKDFNNDLKKIYLASTKDVALEEFKELDNKWGKKYPIAIKILQDKIESLDVVFKYPQEIRKILYGNNILNVYHSQLNKVTKKNYSSFGNNEIINSIYLGISELYYKWKRPIKGWNQILFKLSILFKGRIHSELLESDLNIELLEEK